MKRAWRRIAGLFKKRKQPPKNLAPLPSKRVSQTEIINPRLSSSRAITITPHRYKFARKDLLTVVRPYDYINLRPRRSAAQGGER